VILVELRSNLEFLQNTSAETRCPSSYAEHQFSFSNIRSQQPANLHPKPAGFPHFEIPASSRPCPVSQHDFPPSSSDSISYSVIYIRTAVVALHFFLRKEFLPYRTHLSTIPVPLLLIRLLKAVEVGHRSSCCEGMRLRRRRRQWL